MTAPIASGSGEMFDAIAPRYDLLNRIISLGLDQGWRRRTARSIAIGDDATVLDLATGTGDLALMIAREHPSARILAVDPSRRMLDIAAAKIAAAQSRIELRVGDAQALDLPDHSVDAVTMAFGIRNVPDRPRALREMARVTKPSGKVAILELSEPSRGAFSALARFHIHELVPRIGGALSGKKEYRYLQRSIAAFPPPHTFAAMMEEAGFEEVSALPLTLGVVCLFVGTKGEGA